MSLISVIIPTFNREKMVLRALNSVLAQDFRDFDIWVIDDGSTDNTGLQVRRRASEIPDIEIHYIHTPNRGVSAARNHGISLSGSEWIALLDSDDEWVPGKLGKQIACLRDNPDLSLFHTGELWIRNRIRVNQPKQFRKFHGDVFEKCLPLCMIGPSTVLFSRRLFDEVGGFDEDFPVCEDYDFWLRACSRYEAGLVAEPLTVKYGGHDDQLSGAYVAMDYWRIKSMCRILKIRRLSPAGKAAVIHELEYKGRILLKGYLKHGREDKYHEVLNLIRTVHRDFER